MKLNKILPFFNQLSELLVCETDGFSLQGAVVTVKDNQLVVLHQAKIDQVDMIEAVAELVSQLKKDGWTGGGSAILLSPAVLSTLVELPVNPKKSRPLQQMMALVKGEVDILLMQYMMRWSVGHLLVKRGYLTEEQAQAVMDLQQGKPNPAGGLELLDKFSFQRFGELAEELGYIKRSQLTACLTEQEWLKTNDEQIACNWLAQGAVEDIPGMFNWQVSCVSQSLLHRWVSVFAKQGIGLNALYPISGCSNVFMPDDSTEKILLESHQGLSVSIRESAGHITHQHAYLNIEKSPVARCLESYHTMSPSQHVPVYISCQQAETTELIDGLRQSIDTDIIPLNHSARKEHITLGMLGAATDTFGLGKKGVCVSVLESGPIPPLWYRLEIRAAVLTAVLLVLILISELSLFTRSKTAETEFQKVHTRWTSIDESRRIITNQVNKIKNTQQLLEKQRLEQQRSLALLDFYNQAIPSRVALVENVLSALQSSVSNEVIIISLKENNPQQVKLIATSKKKKYAPDTLLETESFNIEAWALTESAAQTFIQKMQKVVAPSNLEVRDVPVMSTKGPLGLDGFSIRMRLVKRQSLASLTTAVVN